MTTREYISINSGLFSVMLVMGIMAIVFGTVCLVTNSINAFVGMGEYVPVEAEIIGFEGYSSDSLRPRVTYEVNGTRYSEQLNFYSSFMEVNDLVDIYVDISNPHRIVSTNGMSIVSTVFGIISGVFAFVCVVCTMTFVSKRNKISNLISMGRVVQATIIRVEENLNYMVNHRHPFRIVSEYIDYESQLVYTYLSVNLWFFPFAFKEGDLIDVYIHPDNPTVYFVDIRQAIVLKKNQTVRPL